MAVSSTDAHSSLSGFSGFARRNPEGPPKDQDRRFFRGALNKSHSMLSCKRPDGLLSGFKSRQMNLAAFLIPLQYAFISRASIAMKAHRERFFKWIRKHHKDNRAVSR
jgi:hypothetical protein